MSDDEQCNTCERPESECGVLEYNNNNGQLCVDCLRELYPEHILVDWRDEDVEFHAWPPVPRDGGQHTGKYPTGVLAVHRPTGLAATSVDERSQFKNRAAATALLRRAFNSIQRLEYNERYGSTVE